MQLGINTLWRARYAESDRQRGEIQGKYTVLELEMLCRQQVEEELRGQRAQLEQRTRELQQAMHEARTLARYDSLTGLGNRVLFREVLQAVLAQAKQQGSLVALLFLDLDRFKRINDTLGHTVGDNLLREVARRLRQSVRHTDVVEHDGYVMGTECLAR